MAVENLPLMGMNTDHVRAAFRPGGALEAACKDAGRFWKHNLVQEEYAARVWDTLVAPTPMNEVERTRVGLLEASTGTGKSLGYLVPLLLWQATTGERVAVSTYTKSLQRQIHRDEVPIAIETVRRLLGVQEWNPPVAIRVGLGNFLSRRKCERLIEIERDGANPNEDRIEAVRSVVRWLDALGNDDETLGTVEEYAAAQDAGSGNLIEGVENSALTLDYEEVYGKIKQVGVLRAQSYGDTTPNDRPVWRYLRMSDRSRGAALVLINHALTVMQSVRWFRVLDPNGESAAIRAMVCDEAEHLPDMAALYTGTRVSVNNLLKAVDSTGVRALHDALARLGESDNTTQYPGAVPHRMLLPSDASTSRMRRRIIRLAKEAVRETLECAGALGDDRAGDRDYLRDTALATEAWIWRASTIEERQDLPRHRNGDDLEYLQRATVPVLEWSPTKRYPRLVLAPVEPGRILGRFWVRPGDAREPRLHAVIFTSATLADRGSGPDSTGAGQFRMFTQDIGLFECRPGDPRTRQGCWFVRAHSAEPERFGSMDFVIAVDAPSPRPSVEAEDKRAEVRAAAFDEDGEDVAPSRLPPEYLKWMTKVLLAAAREGGRVLALCTSYADAEAIGAACAPEFADTGLSVCVHRRGIRVDEASRQWREQKAPFSTPVFLTPAAWSGVNWPGVIRHLVITKIPFLPPDHMYLDALAASYRERGLIAKARRSKFGAGLVITRWRVRQALGRPIRTYRDAVTVWLPDPGFPLPDWIKQADPEVLSTVLEGAWTRRYATMKDAIPNRFLRKYDLARLMFANGRIVEFKRR